MPDNEYRINIAKSFTISPGGRKKADGDHSGEEFRDDFLLPIVRKAMAEKKTVTVELDGTIGYGSSFLEEAFGGLERVLKKEGNTAIGIIKLESARRPHLIPIIEEMMKHANPKD